MFHKIELLLDYLCARIPDKILDARKVVMKHKSLFQFNVTFSMIYQIYSGITSLL